MPGDPPEECPPTLEERLAHSKWSFRAYGYEQLAYMVYKMGEEGGGRGDEEWRERAGQVALGLGDANVPALEKAYEAAVVLLQVAPPDALAEMIAAAAELVVNKGLPSPRVAKKAQDVLLLMIESGGAETVLPLLIAGMGCKQAKVAAACVTTARTALSQFGTIAPVRTEALPLALELFRWEGSKLRDWYGKLRAVQLKDLDAAIATLDTKKPVPSRGLRGAHSGGGGGGGGGGAAAAVEEEEEEEERPRMRLPAVDVLSKLPKDWADKALKGGKWSERKEYVDKLIDLIGHPTPPLVHGDYSEVVRALRHLMSDSMVLLVSASIKALGKLGEGLGVLEAVHVTLDHWHTACFLLEEVDEPVAAAIGPSANPKVKAEVLKWLHRCFQDRAPRLTANAELAKSAGVLCDAIFACLDDGSAQVREAAYAAGAAMIRTTGSSKLLSRLDELKMDPKKKKKLLEASGKAG